jgi:hypothetical protein
VLQIENLNDEEQKRLVHVHLPKKGQKGYVYLCFTGLQGEGKKKGSAEPGKAKKLKKLKPEKETLTNTPLHEAI